MSIIIIVFLAACKPHKNDYKDKAVGLKKDDSIFLALKDTAQAYIRDFIDTLNVYGKDTVKYKFQIKSDYVDKGVHEHMWSQISKYKNGVFKGLFADSAIDVKNIKAGDSVSIQKKDVEDWVIYNTVDHKSMGYFSEEYLRSKAKKSQK